MLKSPNICSDINEKCFCLCCIQLWYEEPKNLNLKIVFHLVCSALIIKHVRGLGFTPDTVSQGPRARLITVRGTVEPGNH